MKSKITDDIYFIILIDVQTSDYHSLISPLETHANHITRKALMQSIKGRPSKKCSK
jgi:hypothetical protein